MRIKKFEDFEVVWQKARTLTTDIYQVLEDNKDYGFRNQIQEATVSIMNNIAEGYERRSDKEFTHFLYIARGSTGEVRSMPYIALDLGYISKKEFNDLYDQSIEISKMLFGLIKSLN